MTTIQNPVILGDFPDPSILYLDGAFYMTTTSMHFTPGVPIMRSYDLANWEIITYLYDTFLDTPAHRLENGENIYSNGSWATSFRYHQGYFYICFNSNEAKKTFMYRSKDLFAKHWERSVFDGMHHDPTLVFDDGKAYLIYGNGTIYIKELTADAMAIKEDGVQRIFIDTPKVEGLNCEGSQMHLINGKYYLFLIQWPTGHRRIQWCYRADSLLGPYEGKVILDDDMGYHNNGVAQGCMFEAEGNWYAWLFQDRSAFGRVPCVMPMHWENDWPVLGIDGKVPKQFTVPFTTKQTPPFSQNDEFDYTENDLPSCWEWNHIPDHTAWSVTERAGHLRLHNVHLSDCFTQARNSVTQHGCGPKSVVITKLDCSGLQEGDYAGIAALQYRFGTVGVQITNGAPVIAACAGVGKTQAVVEQVALAQSEVYLRICFDFTEGKDEATFGYSLDGTTWQFIGETIHMVYDLAHFAGYRPTLFSYPTKHAGGYADFDFFHIALECDMTAR